MLLFYDFNFDFYTHQLTNLNLGTFASITENTCHILPEGITEVIFIGMLKAAIIIIFILFQSLMKKIKWQLFIVH
jgi:hypothetical protein